jgi:DHA1 family bicyclomycin/chloramphenicol resistance-like MFS transporter
MTLTAFISGLSLGQFFYGPLSDHYGRKPVLLAGLSIYVLGSIGCALAPSIHALIAWRLVQSLGGCVTMVIPGAVVRDRCHPAEAARAFAMLMLVMGVAPILAPLLGAWLVSWASWRVAFVVLAVVVLLCLAAAGRWLDESLAPDNVQALHPGRSLANYGELFRDRHFMGYMLVGAFATCGIIAYVASAPFILMGRYHLSTTRFSEVFGGNSLVLIIASQIGGHLLRHYRSTALLRASLWLPPAGGLLVLASGWAGAMALPVLLTGFMAFIASLGVIMPNSGALALYHQGARAGTAAALMGGFQFATMTAAGMVVGGLPGDPVRVLGLTMVAAAGLMLFAHRRLCEPGELREAMADG